MPFDPVAGEVLRLDGLVAAGALHPLVGLLRRLNLRDPLGRLLPAIRDPAKSTQDLLQGLLTAQAALGDIDELPGPQTQHRPARFEPDRDYQFPLFKGGVDLAAHVVAVDGARREQDDERGAVVERLLDLALPLGSASDVRPVHPQGDTARLEEAIEFQREGLVAMGIADECEAHVGHRPQYSIGSMRHCGWILY